MTMQRKLVFYELAVFFYRLYANPQFYFILSLISITVYPIVSFPYQQYLGKVPKHHTKHYYSHSQLHRAVFLVLLAVTLAQPYVMKVTFILQFRVEYRIAHISYFYSLHRLWNNPSLSSQSLSNPQVIHMKTELAITSIIYKHNISITPSLTIASQTMRSVFSCDTGGKYHWLNYCNRRTKVEWLSKNSHGLPNNVWNSHQIIKLTIDTLGNRLVFLYKSMRKALGKQPGNDSTHCLMD